MTPPLPFSATARSQRLATEQLLWTLLRVKISLTHSALSASSLRNQLHVPDTGGLGNLIMDTRDIAPGVACSCDVDLEVSYLAVKVGSVDIILGVLAVGTGLGASNVSISLHGTLADEVGRGLDKRPVGSLNIIVNIANSLSR